MPYWHDVRCKFLFFNAVSDANSLGRILLVDDEVHITELLKLNLESERYMVTVVTMASQAMGVDLTDYRLVIADAMTQPYDGFDLLRDIKSNPVYGHVPVIILTQNDSEENIIYALDNGADDYVVKPFSLRELFARIRSVFRRYPAAHGADAAPRAGVVAMGNLQIDLLNRQVMDGNIPLPLTRTEFAILALLVRNRNRFFNRIEICNEIWRDSDTPVNDRIVDTNISRLRKKLGDAAQAIVNRTGSGYAVIDL